MSGNDAPITISLRTYGHTADVKSGDIAVDGLELPAINYAGGAETCSEWPGCRLGSTRTFTVTWPL